LLSVALGDTSKKGTGLYIFCLFVVYLMTFVKSAPGTSNGWMILSNKMKRWEPQTG
jgi:hypothetical protein